MLALAVEAVLVAAGIGLFLPGYRRPRDPGGPGAAERYLGHLLGLAAVVLVVVMFRAVQPVATPQGILALGPAFSGAVQEVDAGLRAAFAAIAGEPLDALLAGILLLLHPLMLLLAPALWLAADEERPAKTVLAAFAAFLLLAVPLHFLLSVPLPRARPFPFLPELGALYFPAGDDNTLPGLHAGLALCVALAARRSRNWRFRPLAFAYPALAWPALLYFGVNGVVGVATGAVLAVASTVLSQRVSSVERIAHQRVDAPPERKMAIRQAAEELLAGLREAGKARGLEVEPKLVGSVAKDTFLSHKVDIDAFVLFPPDTPRATLEHEGLALGRALLEAPEERYAEHPYLAGKWKGLEAEVVPAYKVEAGDATMSAVDRTPFHTAYVQRKLEGLQRRDVRLLKQFLLGIGVYGAEAKVQGFSGYLAELLVIKYGSFRGALRAGADWRVGQLIALEPFEGVPRFGDALIVIDPVDPGRNVASALSLDNLLLFQEAARAYLREPRLGFFFPRPVVPLALPKLQELLHGRGHGLVAVWFDRPDVLEDSLHAQLRKCAAALGQALERAGFKPLRWDTHATAGHGIVALELDSVAINEREVHAGPPSSAREHAERFREKWTGNPRALSAVYEERGRLMVARRREHTNAAQFLQQRALELDLGKDLTAVALQGNWEVLGQQQALQQLDPAFLTRFLAPARPWER
jgi:tRNA nucleotidyltransferase (CCA-adding enzyme)